MVPHLIDKACTFIRNKGKPINETNSAQFPQKWTYNCPLFSIALKSVGIFRLPGNSRRINELKKMFDDGADIDLEADDEFDVSSLLKLYFRELPEPLVPSSLFEEFRKGNSTQNNSLPPAKSNQYKLALSVACEDKDEMITHFQEVFKKVPELNREIMLELVQLCNDIVEYEEINKMPARNLCVQH